LNGDWQFTESESYLRQLGALDDTGGAKSIVIPNYISSASNCIASSSFFSVCCRDECEALLGDIERKVKTSTAEPHQILEIVSTLSSDTVDVPRTLSDDLLKRLDEIATHHGGHIPLHGRLFAQWMHHAYPRECPFPHVAGTTNPVTPEEWMAQTGEHGLASEDDMLAATASSKLDPSDAHKPKESLPWTLHEELVWDVPLYVPMFSLPSARALMRAFLFFAAVCSGAMYVLRTMHATSGDQKLGYMV
jgi:diadenosine tetraphosphatase ApaH/serine/threonine PP2A family protein phosphatase